MSEEKTIDQVYADRNAAVLGLAKLAQYLHRDYPEGEIRSCWKPDQGDDADASEWAIIYVWLPTGQVSWHVPRDLAAASDLPRKHAEWDGHDRPEKNRRIKHLAGIS